MPSHDPVDIVYHQTYGPWDLVVTTAGQDDTDGVTLTHRVGGHTVSLSLAPVDLHALEYLVSQAITAQAEARRPRTIDDLARAKGLKNYDTDLSQEWGEAFHRTTGTRPVGIVWSYDTDPYIGEPVAVTDEAQESLSHYHRWWAGTDVDNTP